LQKATLHNKAFSDNDLTDFSTVFGPFNVPSWKQILPPEAGSVHFFKCLSKQDDDIKDSTLHMKYSVVLPFKPKKKIVL
jgi:hypothetical protein